MKTMRSLAGTGALLRLILRRDRLGMPIWVIGFALLVIGVAAAIPTTYPTVLARQLLVRETASNPTELMLIGPVFASSIGGIMAWRVRGWVALGIALAALLTIVRHTRVEEELGRRELLGSAVVGRAAPLTAALVATFGASLVAGLITTGGLVALGLPIAGSLALGLSIVAVGSIFAAITALFSQVVQSAGAARGWVGALLALLYLLRAIGDAGGPSWLFWISPLGWIEAVQPFAQERWWPFILVLVLTLALLALSYALLMRRDVGAGLLPERPGRASAASTLGSPLGLAWRLQRGTLIAWTAGALAVGAALGGVVQSAANQISASAQLRDLIAQLGGSARAADGFFALLIYLLSQAVAGYAISAALRLHGEETAQRADTILTMPVSRLRWVSSYLIVVVIGTVIVQVALGLSMGLTYGLSIGNVGDALPRLLVATLVRLPSIWVLAGLVVALYGLLPRIASAISWAVFAALLLLELLVELHLVTSTALKISPFSVTPGLPAVPLTVMPLVWLVLITIVLTAIGLVSFGHRDIE